MIPDSIRQRGGPEAAAGEAEGSSDGVVGRRCRRILLAALLVWSLLLRGWLATAEPTYRGVYDERFGVRNVAYILESGSLMPDNGFHPSLSYLPALPVLKLSELLFRWTGDDRLRVVRHGPGTEIGRKGLADGLDLTPHGYRLARWVNCLLGVLAIYLTYLVGLRLFGFRVAVVGALLLASVPWHVRQSAVFKPDAVLVTAVVLAFWATLRAVEKGGLARFALAGAAMGLALSTKFNAVPVVAPVVAAMLFLVRVDRSIIARAASSLGVALLVFLVLNPFTLSQFAMFEHDFSATLRLYDRKAVASGMSTPLMVAGAFRWLAGHVYHGIIIGSLAIAGLALQTASVFRRKTGRRERLRTIVFLSFPIVYLALYSVASQNPDGWHNWLALTPFTALAAAFMIVFALKLLPRWPRIRGVRTSIAGLILVVLLLPPVWAASRFAYEGVVPTTAELAREVLAGSWRNAEQRLVYQESAVPPILTGWKKARRFAVAQVESLPDLDQRKLDLSDGEVFPASRLGEPEAELYRRRLTRRGVRVTTVNGTFFSARGDDLVVVEHGWKRVGRPVDVTLQPTGAEGEVSGVVPAGVTSGGALSLEVWLDRNSVTGDPVREGPVRGDPVRGNPARQDSMSRIRVEVDGKATELVARKRNRNRVLFLTPRLAMDDLGSAPSVRLFRPGDSDRQASPITVRIHGWRSAAVGLPETP